MKLKFNYIKIAQHHNAKIWLKIKIEKEWQIWGIVVRNFEWCKFYFLLNLGGHILVEF